MRIVAAILVLLALGAARQAVAAPAVCAELVDAEKHVAALPLFERAWSALARAGIPTTGHLAEQLTRCADLSAAELLAVREAQLDLQAYASDGLPNGGRSTPLAHLHQRIYGFNSVFERLASRLDDDSVRLLKRYLAAAPTLRASGWPGSVPSEFQGAYDNFATEWQTPHR